MASSSCSTSAAAAAASSNNNSNHNSIRSSGVWGDNIMIAQQQQQQQQQQHDISLTAKPHAFGGAVLSPKHAQELTPSLCLAIASALSELPQHQQQHSSSNNRHGLVPYTLWITEAWRVLGWAEPSAALFWEMATLYHTLHLAGQSAMEDAAAANYIPPILSCGSTSSMGSNQTPHSCNTAEILLKKKTYSTSVSAKELPAWLVGTFLLLHCEECAHQRNLSGQDDRRYYTQQQQAQKQQPVMGNPSVDFNSLLQHNALSSRTRLHAGWTVDQSHCIIYLLRHLRKILLMAAIPHNTEAVNACLHLAALPNAVTQTSHSGSRNGGAVPKQPTAALVEELRRVHADEHGQVGLRVKLSLDDLERLHLLLQPPQGGGIDDPPIPLGEYFWVKLQQQQPWGTDGGDNDMKPVQPLPPMATVPLVDVEEELRRHLELALQANDQEEATTATRESNETADNLAKLSLKGSSTSGDDDEDNEDGGSPSAQQRGKLEQSNNTYQKELSYTHLRGTTILLKPNEGPSISSGASATSDSPPPHVTSQRLHDLNISECSDAHFYLLQPFEHATINACSNCTIVVGAVAGLLHVVDCERCTVTSAARRVLVSNSSDVQMCIFTPSPPLLVGDNRTCQFAPYNTYYDGLREDLLATGLAAAVLPESQSPMTTRDTPAAETAAWPPLTCSSNKWKQPVEIGKLEMPSVPTSTPPASPTTPSLGADDRMQNNESSLHAPVLVPAADFQILFVPLESATSTQQPRTNEDDADHGNPAIMIASQYCRLLGELLSCSPFRLPTDYERRVLTKADRMKRIQQDVLQLPAEQQAKFQEELNRGFRDWLVTSGNLRQVLDLVHLERRGGV